MTDQSDFFIAGGTLRARAPSYVTRPADQELYDSVRAGEFCYVLTSRQMGKSSLMVRTARRLKEAGAATVVIDLTSIGTVAVDPWYVGLLARIKADLRLDIDPTTWWQERQAIGAPQRFVDFLRDVVLEQLDAPAVIFVDEIDSTLNLNFRDDFFAAIRSIYNARAGDPAFKRLTFVLLGVATPTDLIQDRARTPFNIGRQIVLQEFSYADALPLREGLEHAHPSHGDGILTWIFDWTSGHPYLTQKLCLAAAQQPRAEWDERTVEALVADSFFSKSERKDTNLTFVQDRIRASPPTERRRMLQLYRRVYDDVAISDDDRSRTQNYLELYGLLRVERGRLRVRNRIYREVFDRAWIAANMPSNIQRTIAIGAGALALLLVALIIYIVRINPPTSASAQAELCRQNFETTSSSAVRLASLACLFERGYNEQALHLFYERLDHGQQKYLFLAADPQVGPQAVTVVRGIYVTLDAQMPHSGEMMDWMVTALAQSQQAEAKNLEHEIQSWKRGRELAAQGQLQQAADTYAETLRLNNNHPVVHYDRAITLIGLKQYTAALTELDQVLRIATTVLPTPIPTTTPTQAATGAPAVTLTPISTPPATSVPGLTPESPRTPGSARTTTPATSSATASATPIVAPTATPGPAGRIRFLNREEIVKTVIETVRADPNLLDALSAASGSYQQLSQLAASIGLPARSAQSGERAPEPAGPLVYIDDFGNDVETEKEKSGLEDQREAKDFSRGFHTPGVYHMQVTRSDAAYKVVLPRFLYVDFSMQIEQWDNSDDITAGDAAAGIVFRARDAEHHYAVLINSRRRQYAVHKLDGLGNVRELIAWKTSSLIKPNEEVNLLRVDAAGDNFKIYVNGMLLDQFSDPSYRSGMVGMIVDNTDAPSPHMHFDNLQIWSNSFIQGAGEIPQIPGMLWLPSFGGRLGSEFVMGSYQRDDQQPPHIVAVESFYIDQTEVTNAEYARCVEASACALPTNLSSFSHSAYYNDATYANYPVINVTWTQARDYCAWAGKRLPSEAEWEKAASWKLLNLPKTIWPWEGRFDAALLNTDARLGDTTAVKQFPEELNGTFDMAGNVWEWTSSLYRPYPYRADDGREDPEAVGDRVFRGGSWAQSAGTRATFRDHAAPTYSNNEIGFRCAATQPPLAVETNSIDAIDQALVGGAITVADASAAQDGWVVVHRDENGVPGRVIGRTFMKAGSSSNVMVKLSEDVPAGERLWAMLHLDAGQSGLYEFPGPDVPVIVNGDIVMKPFTVIAPEPAPTVPQPPTNTPEPTALSVTYRVDVIKISLAEITALPGCEQLAVNAQGKTNNLCIVGPGGVNLLLRNLDSNGRFGPIPTDARQLYINEGQRSRILVESDASQLRVITIGNNELVPQPGEYYKAVITKVQ